MTHVAIREALDGKAVEWLEHITDDEYPGERRWFERAPDADYDNPTPP